MDTACSMAERDWMLPRSPWGRIPECQDLVARGQQLFTAHYEMPEDHLSRHMCLDQHSPIVIYCRPHKQISSSHIKKVKINR